jgi:hypothetical protein
MRNADAVGGREGGREGGAGKRERVCVRGGRGEGGTGQRDERDEGRGRARIGVSQRLVAAHYCIVLRVTGPRAKVTDHDTPTRSRRRLSWRPWHQRKGTDQEGR